MLQNMIPYTADANVIMINQIIVSEMIFPFRTAVNNAVLRESDGICAATAEQCIQNMARIGKNGMERVDEEIIAIMKSKECQ